MGPVTQVISTVANVTNDPQQSLALLQFNFFKLI